MKRILLSLFFLLTWMGSAILADTPVTNVQGQQQTLTLYSPTNDNDFTRQIPIYGNGVNKCQRHEIIYPKEDLQEMISSNISQMDFYIKEKAHRGNDPTLIEWNATFQIYLKEVKQSSFSEKQFIGFSEKDLVYEGVLSGTSDVMPIVFNKNNNSYYYQGGNLLVGVYQITTGTYASAEFWSKQKTNASLFEEGSTTKYSHNLPQTTFHYRKPEQPVLAKPVVLTADEVNLNSATISWISTASSWQICVNDGEEEQLFDTSNKSFTLTDLERDHWYEVKVRAVKGTQVSDWSNAISIRTLYCSPDENVNLSYELHDSNNNGWGTNAIAVKDALTDELLATWTIKTGGSANGTLPVCEDRGIYFKWEGSGYSYQCSYVVRDGNGEIIFEGSGMMEKPVSYTVSSANPRPVELKASDIVVNSAVLSWNERGDATQWQLCFDDDEDNLIPVNSNPFTLTGLEDDTNYTVRVRSYKDADNISKWSEPYTFTTAEICPKPTNLDSGEPGSTEATLSWEGTLDSYVLQYNAWWKRGDDINPEITKTTYTFDLHPFKGTGSIAIRHYNVPDGVKPWLHIDNIEVTNVEGEMVYSEDFENSRGRMPAYLSSIDLDGDGYGWEVLSNKPKDQWTPYDGVYGISSTTWKSGVQETLKADDWLIISDVELGGTLSFMCLSQGLNNNDNFAVYVMADEYMIEIPINNSTSYHATRLFNDVPYLWRVKGVSESGSSRWVSAFFETPYDPHAIATGIQTMDNGQWTIDNYTDEWYTIEGQKLSGKPTKKGVYIYNGKRVVIR